MDKPVGGLTKCSQHLSVHCGLQGRALELPRLGAASGGVGTFDPTLLWLWSCLRPVFLIGSQGHPQTPWPRSLSGGHCCVHLRAVGTTPGTCGQARPPAGPRGPDNLLGLDLWSSSALALPTGVLFLLHFWSSCCLSPNYSHVFCFFLPTGRPVCETAKPMLFCQLGEQVTTPFFCRTEPAGEEKCFLFGLFLFLQRNGETSQRFKVAKPCACPHPGRVLRQLGCGASELSREAPSVS